MHIFYLAIFAIGVLSIDAHELSTVRCINSPLLDCLLTDRQFTMCTEWDMKGRCIGGTITGNECFNIDPGIYEGYNFSSFLPGPETRCNIFRCVIIIGRERLLLNMLNSATNCESRTYDASFASMFRDWPWECALDERSKLTLIPRSFCCRFNDGNKEDQQNPTC
jgi:hypothetical protein